MPRPRNVSKVQKPPRVKGFNPMGLYVKKGESISLHIEEYEAIRLLDYEGLSQVETAIIMEVSRPTLTRIYERARIKVAKVLTEGCQLLIEGGKVQYIGNWYTCAACQSHFNVKDEEQAEACPLCASQDITKTNA